MTTMLEQVQSKICSPQEALARREEYRKQGKKVVFSNGCFDILHRGHVEYLSKARDLGDVLVIGLNTDDSIRRIKGPSRPVQDNTTRASVIGSLQFVDMVVFFDEDTPAQLIDTLVPDVLVKGADYSIENIVGASTVIGNGGQVLTIELTEGHSTTNIINKLLHS